MSGLLGALGGLGQGLGQAGQFMYSNALEEIRMRRLSELQIQSEKRGEERGIRAEGRQDERTLAAEGRLAARQDEVYARNLADQRSLLGEQRDYNRGLIDDERGYESGEKRDFLQFQHDLDRDRYEPIYGPDGSVIERDLHSGRTRAVLASKGSSGKSGGADSQKEFNSFAKDWRDAVVKYQTGLMASQEFQYLAPEEQERALIEGTEQINAQFRRDAQLRGFPLPGEAVGGQNLIQDGGKTYTVIGDKVYELGPEDMATEKPTRESAGRKADRLQAGRGEETTGKKAEQPGLLGQLGSTIRGAFNVREGGLLEHPEDFKNIPQTIRSAANLPEGGLLGVLDQKAAASPTGEEAVQARRERREAQAEAKSAPLPIETKIAPQTTGTAPERSVEDWNRHADAMHKLLVDRGERLDPATRNEVIEQLQMLLAGAPDDTARRRIQFYLDKLQQMP